ncbi:hypothetical protein [Streptomyces drozdowiczii]|uniref:hypothetical protein n=1 Tax=Streptomyces drozdowiczii TaxID=202862 RepID=UPI00403CE7C7
MTDQPAPFRYFDADEFCLSAHLLTTGAPLDTVSITVEGDSDPQSAHVPIGDLARVLAGIAEAAGVDPAVAPTAPLAADEPADRRARYAAAMALRDGHPAWPVQYEDDERDYLRRADAVTPLADTEVVQAMRAMHDTKEEEIARLRAEVERLRTNRATTLHEAADAADLMRVGAEDPTPDDHVRGYNNALDHVVAELRRLADEAQQPETEATVADVPAMQTRMRADAATHDTTTLLHLIATWHRSSEGPDALIEDLVQAGFRLPAPAPTEEPTR